MNFVVDASVAAKWFLSESDSVRAAALLTEQHQIVAPALLKIEVAAAISRQQRLGTIDGAQAQAAFASMLQLLAPPSISFVGDDTLLLRGMEIALQIKHPFQDCLYLACAEASSANLVTSDGALLRWTATQFPFVRPL